VIVGDDKFDAGNGQAGRDGGRRIALSRRNPPMHRGKTGLRSPCAANSIWRQ
jgi:hypothetical protein